MESFQAPSFQIMLVSTLHYFPFCQDSQLLHFWQMLTPVEMDVCGMENTAKIMKNSKRPERTLRITSVLINLNPLQSLWLLGIGFHIFTED